MTSNLKTKQKGFTIIEVMIVLAIVGMIMLVVFLAVPALQRNSRNTQRKADVSSILGAVNEYISNNNGTLPSSAPTWSSPTLSLNGGTVAAAKLGFYTAGIGTTAQGQVGEALTTATWPVTAMTANATNDRVNIVNGGKCDTTTAGQVIQGSPRQVAVQYEIETTGGYAAACQDS